jgi:hypothetical protein
MATHAGLARPKSILIDFKMNALKIGLIVHFKMNTVPIAIPTSKIKLVFATCAALSERV